MQPNIAMKYAEYVVWILLRKKAQFGEKIATISEISNFFYGGYFLWRALYMQHATTPCPKKNMWLHFLQ